MLHESKFVPPPRPKAAPVPSTPVAVIQPKSWTQINADHDAGRDLTRAVKLSSGEAYAQITSLKKARKEQTKRERPARPAQSGPTPEPVEEQPELVRFRLISTSGVGEDRAQFCEGSPLPMWRALLESKDSYSHVTAEGYVFLVVYHPETHTAEIHLYSRVAAANVAADKAREKGARATVSSVLRRSEVLQSLRAPARDEIRKSRDNPVREKKNYVHKGTWMKNPSTTRAHFSHG